MSELGQHFREGMRRLAATVNIVTTQNRAGDPMGMTATAITSLTAEPPSLLMCINQSASMHDSLEVGSRFCVNVLHSGQSEIAKIFANANLREHRFSYDGWCHDESAPYLRDALATFVCQSMQLIAFETHTICIGSVSKVHLRDNFSPLIYLDGKFCSIESGII